MSEVKNKTISVRKFSELLNQGLIEINLMGHSSDIRSNHSLNNSVKFALKMQEEHINPSDKLYDFYHTEIEIGVPFFFGMGMIDSECDACGERTYLGLIDDKTISIFRKEGEGFTNDFVYDDKCRCEYEHGIPPQKAVLNFQDEIIFANAFRNSDMNWLFQDAPEEKEYDDEYSLSTAKGRKGITKFKEDNNVAWGCMSNMSIAIYANAERDHFVITTPFLEDYEECEGKAKKRQKNTFEYLSNGFENLGTISLGVWRWEATDRKTLDALGYDDENHKRDYENLIKVKIPSGQWELTHYFDSFAFGYNFDHAEPKFESDTEIYSELKLIK